MYIILGLAAGLLRVKAAQSFLGAIPDSPPIRVSPKAHLIAWYTSEFE